MARVKTMENFKIEAYPRKKGNKGSRKKLRNEGMLPAIVYGRNIEPRAVTLNSIDLKKALSTTAGTNVLLDLEIAGDDGSSLETVMVKELQTHPLQRDFYLHADLIRISLEDKLEVEVPLSLAGEPVGVSEDEGVLQIQIREVTVRCLPTDIPEYIEVSVEHLGIGDVLTVGELQPPHGVEILAEPAEAIASVLIPQVEEEVVEEEEELDEELAEAEEGEEAGEAAEEEEETEE
ncbi:MAG: 50S ribosomal protein L25 [Firmicutes bacterium]|nr:50S ribosomal protein L25 [Bacillota bacterium]